MKDKNFKRYFVQGYACAVANLIRDHGHGTEAEDCYGACFYTVAQLRRLEVDESDIDVLRPVIKEIQRRQKTELSRAFQIREGLKEG